MGNFDHDNSIASMLEELPRLRDDTFWPPFPEWMRELKLLPTPERLRGQFKRRSRGMSEEERLRAEWLHLKRLRQLQSDYKTLADFLPALPKIGAALNGSLTSVIFNAFSLGQGCPPETRTSPATEKTKGRTPKWYAVADEVRADLATKPSVRGTTPSKRARYKLLHKHVSERLVKLNMKPVSEFAVRDYLTHVDRKRT